MKLCMLLLVTGAVLGACSSPSTEKEPPVIVIDMGAPNASIDCGEGRSYCGESCIDTSIDSLNCGDCGVECPEQTVCSQSDCVPVPADCRTGEEECPTSYYCDETTGLCALGCDTNEDCPSGSFCQVEANTCLCQTEGEVVCGSQCVAEGPTACGVACETCPVPPNSTASCIEGECRFECNRGAALCDGTCATCPSDDGIAATGCDGASCVATECDDGYELCNGVCAACPSGDPRASFGCDGTECVVTDCPTGTRLCDGTCDDCPDPAGGTLQCSGNQCTLACNAGLHLCDDACVPDDDPNNCGSNCEVCPGEPNGAAVCEQGSCGVSCDADFRECEGACAACPTVGVATTRCAGGSCVAASCQAGFYACSQGCCQDPAPGLVATAGANPASLDVAIDANGFPTGVYATGGGAGFFFWNGQQWVVEPLPSLTFAAMDLDANGVAHVAGYSSSNNAIHYLNRMSGTFVGVTPTTIGGGSGLWKPDIAIDDAGNAHVIFKTLNDVTHVTSADGWTARDVDSNEPSSDVALIWNGGRLHAVYADGPPNPNGDVYYRWYDESSGWSAQQTVNPGLNTGGRKIGIAGAPNGDIWAMWGGTVASAAKGPGTWTNIGEASPTAAIEPVIAMDSGGTPHIFYYYYGIQQVSWMGPGWSAETEITANNSHEQPASVFDANGTLHFFYFAGADLNYMLP